jgi:urea transport system ATP-binding protein
MLSVEAIDLAYGSSQILRQVSVTATKGEVTCLLGRNGVGKTSLLRAIFGLQPIRAGKITWEGERVDTIPAHRRAGRGMALVPQGREIFPRLSVLENLQTGLAPLPAGQRNAIPDHIFELFPVLKTMLHRRGGDLSGGQQQQLAIGRALVSNPRCLVLDEPTEGIQPSIIKEIGRIIRQLAERGDMAILLVEQYLDFARELADSIVIMERGEVVLAGRNADLDDAEMKRYLAV